MRKSILNMGKLVAWIACILGGLASFLQWLGIKPKELAMTQPIPHFMWLILAVILCGFGIWSSLRSGFFQQRRIKHLNDTLLKERESLQQCKDDLAESANRNLEYRGKIAELQDAHADEKRRLETQSSAELSRAQESYRQCKEERNVATEKLRELEDSLPLFSSLQIEALRFRRRLQNFIAETGPEPVMDDSNVLDPEKNSLALADWLARKIAFTNLLDSTYKVQFHNDAVMLYNKFRMAGIVDIHFGSLLDIPGTVVRLKELDALLWTKIGMLQ